MGMTNLAGIVGLGLLAVGAWIERPSLAFLLVGGLLLLGSIVGTVRKGEMRR